MKHFSSVLLSVLLISVLLCSCTQITKAPDPVPEEVTMKPAAELLADIPTTQYFTDDAVADEDLQTILMAGINTPSAMNGQPWHFTAITDASVLQQIADDMKSGPGFGGPPPAGFTPPGGAEMAPPADGAGSGAIKAGIADAPLAIVISCASGSELDAGLACQNMSATAQLLGYGSKIISSPTIALNGEKQSEYQALLGIPETYAAAAILLIGFEDPSMDETVDGYTGATARNPMDELVTYLK